MHARTVSKCYKNLPDAEPLVSIVIVNFNGGEMLIQCLKSVFDCEYKNIEVILVDNGSTDRSVRLAEKLFGEKQNFKVVKLRRNIGFAQGNNVGVRRCKGKYIVFLNNDTIVDRKWLNGLVKTMESNESVGVAQSKLLQLRNPRLFDSTGDFIDSYGLTFRRGCGDVDHGQYDRVEEIFSARGATMIVRSSVLKEIGLFDPSLFGSYEDIDLCWRVRLRGYKVVYVPQSVVYHAGGATVRKLSFSPLIFYQTKNLLTASLKNKDTRELLRHSPLIPIVGAMVVDIIKRRNPEFFSVRLKAMLQVLKELREIWQKRLQVQKMKKRQSHINTIILKSGMIAITRLFLYSLKFGGNAASKIYFSLLMDSLFKKDEYGDSVPRTYSRSHITEPTDSMSV